MTDVLSAMILESYILLDVLNYNIFQPYSLPVRTESHYVPDDDIGAWENDSSAYLDIAKNPIYGRNNTIRSNYSSNDSEHINNQLIQEINQEIYLQPANDSDETFDV